jgi:predicted secreted protein
MRRSAAPAVSALLAASLLCLCAAPALAGDAALADFIGFSEDGQTFAFEQYGVQDGSGFAYSTILVVDLIADKWVAGSPFRTQAPEENADRPLANVRADARALATSALDSLAIATPAETLWLDGTSTGDGKNIAFSYGPFPDEENTLSLTLTTALAESSLDCMSLTGNKPLGFRLSFASGAGEAVTKHDDNGKVPASRGCTTDYRLYAVVRPFQSVHPAVAIIASYPFGFEGPDRRFLAVPLN